MHGSESLPLNVTEDVFHIACETEDIVPAHQTRFLWFHDLQRILMSVLQVKPRDIKREPLVRSMKLQANSAFINVVGGIRFPRSETFVDVVDFKDAVHSMHVVFISVGRVDEPYVVRSPRYEYKLRLRLCPSEDYGVE